MAYHPAFRPPASEDLLSHSVRPVFLHIGTMKSGTTYLQKVLVDHEDQLEEAGVNLAGETWGDQVRAAREVAWRRIPDPVFRTEATGAWDSLTRQIHAHRGTASVVSMEFLASVGRRQAAAIAASLAPAEVHVVLTVRDAVRVIPGQWQTNVKAMGRVDWADYRAGIRRAAGLRARLGRFSDPVAAGFREIHDVRRILDAWASCVPADRLHVVTAPPSGSEPHLLWHRFADVVGLDPGLAEDTSPANESLGYASTELVRRVNLALSDVPLHEHVAIVKRQLAERILSQRTGQEVRPRLDTKTFEFALGWNARTREAVARTGARLLGDLTDLPTHAGERETHVVDDAQPAPTDEELLAAADDARAGMRALLERQERRAGKRGLDPAVAEQPVARSRDSADPVAAAVVEVARLCRTSIELRRRLRS